MNDFMLQNFTEITHPKAHLKESTKNGSSAHMLGCIPFIVIENITKKIFFLHFGCDHIKVKMDDWTWYRQMVIIDILSCQITQQTWAQFLFSLWL